MNRYVNTETTFHMMNLLQLGANVQVVTGKMIYVEFELENGLEVAYVYHINKKDKYFLERIKPYPLPIKELENPMDVINLIRIDYEQFNNVVKSHLRHLKENNKPETPSNLQSFISINKRLHLTMKTLEDLFLYYRLPKGSMSSIEKSIDEIQQKIDDLATECNRVYFEKNPDNLQKKE